MLGCYSRNEDGRKDSGSSIEGCSFRKVNSVEEWLVGTRTGGLNKSPKFSKLTQFTKCSLYLVADIAIPIVRYMRLVSVPLKQWWDVN